MQGTNRPTVQTRSVKLLSSSGGGGNRYLVNVAWYLPFAGLL
jgi:hypothetical protein